MGEPEPPSDALRRALLKGLLLECLTHCPEFLSSGGDALLFHTNSRRSQLLTSLLNGRTQVVQVSSARDANAKMLGFHHKWS